MDLLRSIFWRGLRCPSRVAIVDDRRTYTFGRVLAGSLHMAGHIERETMQPNVGLMLPTSGAMAISLLGTWLAGRVAVPLNFLLSAEEICKVVDDSGIDTIFTVGPLMDLLGLAGKLPPRIKIVKIESLRFEGFPPLRWPGDFSDDDLAVILYTSGTSGLPKGVMLTHGNLYSNVVDSIEHANLKSVDTFLGVLPQFHSFGLTVLTLIPLYLGAKVVYTARFVPKKLMQLMREHRPEVFIAVPSMYNALLGVKGVTADDFRSLRLPVSGGEPLPEVVYNTYLNQMNVKLLEGYGLTETSPVSNWSAPATAKRKSVGLPIPHVTVRIVDDEGRVVPAGQSGEILIAGSNIMKGYYRRPAMTAEVMTQLEGKRYFKTGDIGHVDDEGFLFITGRKKEAMKIGGMLVFPRSIEEAINKHPTVKDSAVIGKSDPVRGEVAVAYVELRDGQTFDEMSIRAFCREHLAQYKVPREIYPIPQLPRSPTGKILRRALK
ncbi:long-chain fatty acid--CoA ligase [soil metagenome]